MKDWGASGEEPTPWRMKLEFTLLLVATLTSLAIMLAVLIAPLMGNFIEDDQTIECDNDQSGCV